MALYGFGCGLPLPLSGFTLGQWMSESGLSLGAMLTLVATDGDEVVGFASLKGADVIEMIYVDPEFARRGVGVALLDALEKIARGRGATKLEAEVSDTAKPLFDRRQFTSQRRRPLSHILQTVAITVA